MSGILELYTSHGCIRFPGPFDVSYESTERMFWMWTGSISSASSKPKSSKPLTLSPSTRANEASYERDIRQGESKSVNPTHSLNPMDTMIHMSALYQLSHHYWCTYNPRITSQSSLAMKTCSKIKGSIGYQSSDVDHIDCKLRILYCLHLGWVFYHSGLSGWRYQVLLNVWARLSANTIVMQLDLRREIFVKLSRGAAVDCQGKYYYARITSDIIQNLVKPFLNAVVIS